MQNDCICLRLQHILCRCDDIVYKGFHAKIVITNNGIQMLAFSNDMFNQRLDHAKVVVADNGIQMLAFPNDMFMQRLPCKRLMVQSKASMQMSLLPAIAYKCLRFPTICSKRLAIVSKYISDSVEISRCKNIVHFANVVLHL